MTVWLIRRKTQKSGRRNGLKQRQKERRKSGERGGFETKREALEYEQQKKLSSSRSRDMKLSEFMEVYFEDKQNDLKGRKWKIEKSLER